VFGINGMELIIILGLAFFIFGPEGIPKAAIQLGKIMREANRLTNGATEDFLGELTASSDSPPATEVEALSEQDEVDPVDEESVEQERRMPEDEP
jgi:Sec-independent protein translocase protein TatA